VTKRASYKLTQKGRQRLAAMAIEAGEIVNADNAQSNLIESLHDENMNLRAKIDQLNKQLANKNRMLKLSSIAL